MWFTWGPGDLWAELRLINQRLGDIAQTLTGINRKQDTTMALVAIEQNDLDSIATTVSQVADTLQAVLDSETPLAPADQRGVEDALTKLKAVAPRVPTDAPLVSQPVEDTDTTPPVPGVTDGTTDQGGPVNGTTGTDVPADSAVDTSTSPEESPVTVDPTPAPGTSFES